MSKGTRAFQNRVRSAIESAVVEWVGLPTQREGALGVLRREGFPLHRDSPQAMGILAGLAYRTAGGRVREVEVQSAVAMELFMAASYVLDHAMDEEPPPGSTVGVETAHGLGLLLLAHAALDSVSARALPEGRRLSLSREAHRLLLGSCGGQLEEMLLVDGGLPSDFTTDDALELTQLKAGSLGRLAAVIGCGLAQAADSLTSLVAECFEAYATYRQLIDDLSDAPDIPGTAQKSDAFRGKPTVPLVYLRNSIANPHGQAADTKGSGRIMRWNRDVRADELEGSGAGVFAGLVAEILRNRVIELACAIESKTGSPLPLSLFLT